MAKETQAWLLISVEENEASYAGNDGYDDLPSVSYSWDSQVPNCGRLQVGDFIALWNAKSALLGTSIIEKIEVAQGTKSMFRCPFCERTEIRKRSLTLDYKCDKCKMIFPKPTVERREVTKYKSLHSQNWIDSLGVLSPEELRPLALNLSTQHSMRLMDSAKFLALYRTKSSPHAASAIEKSLRRADEFKSEAVTETTAVQSEAKDDQVAMGVGWHELRKDGARLQHVLLNLRRGGTSHQAPHEPLLVLYLLNRYWEFGQTAFNYNEMGPVLTELLGIMPGSSTPQPSYAWWRLRNDDDVWQIDHADQLTTDTSGNVSAIQLNNPRHVGRWSPWATRALRTVGAAMLFEELADTYFTAEQQDKIFEILARDVHRRT
jgi:ribosomal protein L37AE/L43A